MRRKTWAVALLVVSAHVMGCSQEVPPDRAKRISITNARIVDFVSPSGRSKQRILCTVTNSNNTPIYAIDGEYTLTLVGPNSGAVHTNVIPHRIHSEKLTPGQTVTQAVDSEDGLGLDTQRDGRCTRAAVKATKAYDSPQPPEKQ